MKTMDASSSSSSSSSKLEELEESELYKFVRTSSSSNLEEESADIDLIKAAMYGNAQIFDEPNLRLEHFSRKGVEKNNILHVAVRYKRRDFIRKLILKKKYLGMNKKLISERNSHGNTPFHIAAQVDDDTIAELLYGVYQYMKKVVEAGGKQHDDDDDDDDDDEGNEEEPWRAQNSQGNTPLHLALVCNNGYIAKCFLKMDGGLATIVNNSQEAPLHLAIAHLEPFDCEEVTSILLKKARCVATWRDAKGLTPLLRAASLLDASVIVQVTKNIIDVYPESTLICDPFGKSFLHLLMLNKMFHHLHQNNLDKQFKTSYKNIEDLISLQEISIYKNHQDQDGNTPLYIALNCDNIHMARSLVSKYPLHLDVEITNNDGITARFLGQQLNLWHQLHGPRAMTKEESSSANKGDINFLLGIQQTTGFQFYGSKDDDGSNFFHLLMKTTTAKHHHLFSSDYSRKFLQFITDSLYWSPELVCQTDKVGNTPLHILAQNKDLCTALADHTTLSKSRGLLSKLLSSCDNAITKTKSCRTTTNAEADNYDLPWVMQNSDGNTPLHEAILANNKLLVLQFLHYSLESLRIVNKNKETPLHLVAATINDKEEFTIEEIMKIVNANNEALGLPDKEGLIPILRAVKAENLQMVGTLLCNGKKFSEIDGQKFWHLILNNPSKNFVKGILQNEAFRTMLQQKDKDGYTPLHLAMKEKCFRFVENILETWERVEQQLSGGKELASNQWLLDLLKILDKDGLTPIIRALNADNLNLATRLCHVNPEAAKMGDINGKTIWHLLLKHPSYNSVYVKNLLQTKGLREVLEQKDKNGNTPLHLAMKEKCFSFAQDLFETCGSEGKPTERQQLQDDQCWLLDLLQILDNDGVTPIIRALYADNPDLAMRLCHVSPEAAKLGDINGKTIWHLLSKPALYKSENVKELLENEALRKVLIQKDKDGNTALHLAIKEKCFDFVQDILEASGSEHELLLEEDPWPMDLLITPNNFGETPEDLLADLSIIPNKLEKKLLTDHRMRGIRSSWRIPKTQLQNYMSSMNVIAALQTTITFTAAFTVPGGLNQDIGTPILIRHLSFQVFMISDVIAMCLSMMVLICLLWMVATDKRKSVMIQDFALTLLLLSFVATILTFMAGVYATIYPMKPWIAISTLVLCSLLMLFLPRRVLTNVLLHFKYPRVRFVKKMFSRPCC